MFHIFRWRRDPNAEPATPSAPGIDQQAKISHSRHHHLRLYHGKQPFERLFHARRHRSPSHDDKQQVMINKLFTI